MSVYSRTLKHVNHKDFRRTHQRHLGEQEVLRKIEKEKLIQEKKELEEIKKISSPLKSNWRKDLLREFGEWVPIANAGGPTMGTSTTFGYYSGGTPVINGETGQPITYTASGLGGSDSLPTTVTIDTGGGDFVTVAAPTYSQLSLAGYASPLPFLRRSDLEDVNAMLDASQQFAQAVGADYMMNARVDLDELQQLKIEFKKFDLLNISDEEIEAVLNAIKSGYLLGGDSNYTSEPPYIEYRAQSIHYDPTTQEPFYSADKVMVKIQLKVPPYTGINYTDERNRLNSEYNKEVSPLYTALSKDSFEREPSIRAEINAVFERYQKLERELQEKHERDQKNYFDLRKRTDKQWNDMVNMLGDLTRSNKIVGPKKVGPEIVRPKKVRPKKVGPKKVGPKIVGPKKVGPKPTPKPPAPKPPTPKPPAGGGMGGRRGSGSSPGGVKGSGSSPKPTPKPPAGGGMGGARGSGSSPGALRISPDDEKFIKDMSILPKIANVAGGLGLAGDLAIRYAKGDYRPVTKSPGSIFDNQVLNLISRSMKMKGLDKNSVPDKPYSVVSYPQQILDAPVRGSLGQFNYQITPKGVRVNDTFNFNDNTNIGALEKLDWILKPIYGTTTQKIANRLVDIGDKRARSLGFNPDDNKFGIPINYTIPKSRLSPAQRKQFYGESTTWDRVRKHLKGA